MITAIVAIIGIMSLTAAVIFGEKPVVPAIQPDPAFICLFVVLILIPWIIVAMKIFHIKLGSPKYENNNRPRNIQDSHRDPGQRPTAKDPQRRDTKKPHDNDGGYFRRS